MALARQQGCGGRLYYEVRRAGWIPFRALALPIWWCSRWTTAATDNEIGEPEAPAAEGVSTGQPAGSRPSRMMNPSES